LRAMFHVKHARLRGAVMSGTGAWLEAFYSSAEAPLWITTVFHVKQSYTLNLPYSPQLGACRV